MMRPQSIQRKIREGILLSHDDSGFMPTVVKTVLWLTRSMEKAKANARNIAITRKEISFSNLPESFDGAGILFLSDLHFPGFDGFSDRLEQLLKDMDFDYCFLGGDFSNGTGSQPEKVIPCLKRLLTQLGEKTRNIYSVLGNHDIYDTAVFMDNMGVKVLINDSCLIKRGSHSIPLVGLDDHHHYRSTDWELAEESLSGAYPFRILLSHSPDNHSKAAKKGYSLMLSGHTHGGQICLPPGIPVITHSRSKGRFARGYWEHHSLKGYTSSGTGTSPMGLRFYSQPEICLFTLKRR